jgi:2-hydroxychromene-2-carboxylate isomerase
MTIRLTFFFDYTSPFAYLADAQLRRLEADYAIEIEHRPIGVLGLMKKVGNTPTTACPSKLKYQLVDLVRCAKHQSTPVKLNPHVMRMDSRWFAKAALELLGSPGFRTFHEAPFQELWRDCGAFGDETEFASWANQTIASANPHAKYEVPSTTGLLDAANDTAAALGVFGSPTILVGEEMFFGNDRLHFVEGILKQQSPPTRSFSLHVVSRVAGVEGVVEMRGPTADEVLRRYRLLAPECEVLSVGPADIEMS